MDSRPTFKKFWQTDEVNCVLADGSAGNRLFVIHAGSEDGSVAGAQLIYESGHMSRVD